MFDTTLPQDEDIRPPCPATNDAADSVDLFVRETYHRMKNMLTLLGARTFPRPPVATVMPNWGAAPARRSSRRLLIVSPRQAAPPRARIRRGG